MLPTFKIFLGDAKTIYLNLVKDACCGGGPVDLTNCSEIALSLPNQDGSTTVLLKSTGAVVITAPAVLGGFSALISSLASAALNVGTLQPLDVTFTIGGEIFTVRFDGALSVYEGSL